RLLWQHHRESVGCENCPEKPCPVDSGANRFLRLSPGGISPTPGSPDGQPGWGGGREGGFILRLRDRANPSNDPGLGLLTPIAASSSRFHISYFRCVRRHPDDLRTATPADSNPAPRCAATSET